MATMPLINDDMVELFRRTGKQHASYAKKSSTRPARDSSTVVRQSLWCPESCGPGKGVIYCYDEQTKARVQVNCQPE